MWSQGTFWCQLSTQVAVSSNKGNQFSWKTLHRFPNYSGKMCWASSEISSYLLELLLPSITPHLRSLTWRERFTVKLSRLISAHCVEENLIFTIVCWIPAWNSSQHLFEKNQMGPFSGSKVHLNQNASSFCLSNVPGDREAKGTNRCWTCASAFIKLFLNWLLSCVGWSCGHVGVVYI